MKDSRFLEEVSAAFGFCADMLFGGACGGLELDSRPDVNTSRALIRFEIPEDKGPFLASGTGGIFSLEGGHVGRAVDMLRTLRGLESTGLVEPLVVKSFNGLDTVRLISFERSTLPLRLW